MHRLSIGMLVIDIRERHVGNVSELLGDCFLVDRKHPPQTWNLTQDALFNVDSERATLVCELQELHRYGCLTHGVKLRA